MDDIREGKRTILVAEALKTASVAQKNTLEVALGNDKLTVLRFEAARAVLRDTGALDSSKAKIKELVEKSQSFILRSKLPPDSQKFLSDLAGKLLVFD
jgi:geranylgeranyl diphosphate synthase type I